LHWINERKNIYTIVKAFLKLEILFDQFYDLKNSSMWFLMVPSNNVFALEVCQNHHWNLKGTIDFFSKIELKLNLKVLPCFKHALESLGR
jgi:hypothetical protein